MRSFIVALVTSCFVTAATIVSQTQPPAPGRLIDLGGWQMHLNCSGNVRAGQPTVILEAGSSDFSIDWAFVQPEVATFARVCSYRSIGQRLERSRSVSAHPATDDL